VHGLQIAGAARIVAEAAADLGDRLSQNLFADGRVRPDAFQQRVARPDLTGRLGERHENARRLGRELELFLSAKQRSRRRIEWDVADLKHGGMQPTGHGAIDVHDAADYRIARDA